MRIRSVLILEDKLDVHLLELQAARHVSLAHELIFWSDHDVEWGRSSPSIHPPCPSLEPLLESRSQLH